MAYKHTITGMISNLPLKKVLVTKRLNTVGLFKEFSTNPKILPKSLTPLNSNQSINLPSSKFNNISTSMLNHKMIIYQLSIILSSKILSTEYQ